MKEHRNLRAHVRARKKGPAVTYYSYDMRPYGMPDIPLGTDRAAAIKAWAELQAKYPHRPGKTQPTARPQDDPFLALPAWARAIYSRTKGRAKARGRAFTITRDQFVEIVRRDTVCAISGTAFAVGGPPRHPLSPSLDRINSACGYEFGNVRLVTLAANMAMNTWGEKHLAELASGMLKKCSGNLAGHRDDIG